LPHARPTPDPDDPSVPPPSPTPPLLLLLLLPPLLLPPLPLLLPVLGPLLLPLAMPPLLLPLVVPPLELPLPLDDCAPESELAKGETSLLPHPVDATARAITNCALTRSMFMTRALSRFNQIFSDTLTATRSTEARVTP
jgi:hypothetical protein